MAARPLPFPEPPRSQRKTKPAGTAATSQKQRFLQMFQKNLHASAKKRWLRVAGIVVAAFFVLLVALPFLINVNSFRPKIESEATNALGRQVKLGDLSLSILSGTVGIENISIADDPAFSKSSFITAKSLPRRTVLRGLAATMSLPFLEAMIPAFALRVPRTLWLSLRSPKMAL